MLTAHEPGLEPRYLGYTQSHEARREGKGQHHAGTPMLEVWALTVNTSNTGPGHHEAHCAHHICRRQTQPADGPASKGF